MASPVTEQSSFSDVRQVGYLRKPKNMHKRFFVLRAATTAGPSRLEYYENEKKWRLKSGVPKRSIPLDACFNINKRADSKNKYLVALYTKDEYFSIAAESEQEQEVWYQALVDLHNRGKVQEVVAGSGTGEENYGKTTPGPAFKEVWQVILKPKGLGQTKNLIGIYRLCLTNKTLSFVKLNSDAAAVVLQLMNIRRCGHSENFFFIEVGRSAVTGAGEFWMQVDDSVVAQNVHETILEAMKAMSEEFRPRSKSQSSSNCSNPISVPLRRHHHNNPPPSQVGLGRRSRGGAETATATSPGVPKHSQSFRVRASSDGEGTMSRPASVDGSPGSPGAARTQSHTHRGASRLHPPLNHSRSIPVTPCYSPSATSPASLSSSCTSGHGSTSDCLFPRHSSASVSGSPSDGGFISSSDEYGSSPCDFRSSFRSVTPDSLGVTPPAREEELNNYICMAKPATPLPGGRSGRSLPRGARSCLDEPDLERCFRKRTRSSGTPPPAVCHQKTLSQSSMASLEEYAVMTPAHSCSRGSGYRRPASAATAHSYPEEGVDILAAGTGNGGKDDGYMPMSPGAAPAAGSGADYMPMTPKSVSEPQQIINPRQHPRMDSNGYMMMSPSGSCSPDITNFDKIWINGVDHKLSAESAEGKALSCGDYIDMSPASCSATSTPPDCYFNPVEELRRPGNAYFSLPRSFKHTNRKTDQSPLRLSLGSGRDRPARPARLSLEGNKASTLPRARECAPSPLVPKSPGEYVSIEFSDEAFSASLATLFSPAFSGGGLERPRELLPSDYATVCLDAEGRAASSTQHTSPTRSDSYAAVETEAPSSLVRESRCVQDYGSTQAEASTGGVSLDGQMTLDASASNVDVTPYSVSPGQDLSVHFGLASSLSGLSAFTRVKSGPSWNQGAKVIRADQRGRRRHSSETFSSTGNKGAVGAATPAAEDVKRHSSASIENVWLKLGESPAANGNRESSPCTSAQNQNGLNYMDLDLSRDHPRLEWGSSQTSREDKGSGGSEDLSAYARITFHNAEEVWGNPSYREE